MQDDAFEWDDAKASSNWTKHGVTFVLAKEAFRDAFAVEIVDGRQATESRFVLLGVVEGRLPFVAFTMRGDRVRIISARKAEARERRRYDEENRNA